MVQPLHISFQGLNEGDDPRAQPPGALLAAENYAMDKARRLVKRDGTEALARNIFGGGAVSAGKRLQTRGGDLVIEDGELALAHAPELGAWRRVGRTSPLRMTQRGLVDSTRSAIAVDVAVHNGFLIVATLSGQTPNATTAAYGSMLTVQAESLATGERLFFKVVATDAAWVRLNVSGSSLLVTYSTADATKAVIAKLFDLATFALVTTVTVGASAVYTPAVDAAVATPAGGVPTLYVAWDAGGADRLCVNAYRISDMALVAGPVKHGGVLDPIGAVSVAATPTGVFVLWGTVIPLTSKTNIIGLHQTTLAVVVALKNVGGYSQSLSVSEYDATRLLVCLVGSDTLAIESEFLATVLVSKSTLNTIGTTMRATYQVASMSRPWTLDGRWFLLATMALKPDAFGDSKLPNASCVVVEIRFTEDAWDPPEETKFLGPHLHVGTAHATTGWLTTARGHVSQVPVFNDIAYVPAAYRNQEPVRFDQIPVGWNLHFVELARDDAHRLAVVGRGGLAAAGAPYWLDGDSTYPYGFAHPPVVSAVPAPGGGLMEAGTYTYVAVYEWRDKDGVLHRSMPSPPVETKLTATGHVTLTLATSSLSNKQRADLTGSAKTPNPVSIALYRTTKDGSTYYRLTLEPEHSIVLNNPRARTVDFVDKRADADIGGGSPARPLNMQPQLYTATGELEDVPPPSFVTCVTHGGRLAGLDGTLRTVWFSKVASEDPGIAPGFHEQLTIGFASDKVALASLDETLVVFGRDDIDVVFGKGPDATGLGAWEVSRVQTDVGCVNPRSVVTTPVGVAFLSRRGLELFDRSRTPSWVGKAVEDTLRAYPVITSAVLVAKAHEVRWTCNSEDDGEGVVLAWDYVNKIWFVRRYYENAPFADAALVGGVYTLLAANGQVYQETKESKLDGGQYVEAEARTAPMSPAGNLAWHRVKDVAVLGESVSPHRLEISIRRDYASAWEQVKTFDELPKALERVRVTLKHQKCQAVEVRIRDLAPDTSDREHGEGAILYGLALRVGVKNGIAKTSAEEQG